MGGRIEQLNSLTRDIWEWCIERHIWLSVFHIPGKMNSTADKLSRQKNDNMEWALNIEVFMKLEHMIGSCDIDMFASRANKKLPIYVSYKPDVHAYAINAFSISWTDFNCIYMFPPFSVLGAVLQKIDTDCATAIVIAPVFTTQVWFPRLIQMISGQSYLLPETNSCLYLPGNPGKKHSLTKMHLAAFQISGNTSLVQDYRQKLPTLSWHHGDRPLRNNITHISRSGCTFAVRNKLITLTPL